MKYKSNKIKVRINSLKQLFIKDISYIYLVYWADVVIKFGNLNGLVTNEEKVSIFILDK